MFYKFEIPGDSPVEGRALYAFAADEAARIRFLRSLQEAGVSNPCRFFGSGDDYVEALMAVLNGAPPPLICFLEDTMNGMSGLDVLRWIRMQSPLSESSVVLVSSANDANALNDALLHGAQCCLRSFPVKGQMREIMEEAGKFSRVARGQGAFHIPCNLLVLPQAVNS